MELQHKANGRIYKLGITLEMNAIDGRKSLCTISLDRDSIPETLKEAESLSGVDKMSMGLMFPYIVPPLHNLCELAHKFILMKAQLLRIVAIVARAPNCMSLVFHFLQR